MPRISGSNRRISEASDAPGSAITTHTGAPWASAIQVSTVAGAGNRSRGAWVFWILRVPW
jgi:hypothetical protein